MSVTYTGTALIAYFHTNSSLIRTKAWGCTTWRGVVVWTVWRCDISSWYFWSNGFSCEVYTVSKRWHAALARVPVLSIMWHREMNTKHIERCLKKSRHVIVIENRRKPFMASVLSNTQSQEGDLRHPTCIFLLNTENKIWWLSGKATSCLSCYNSLVSFGCTLPLRQIYWKKAFV